MFEWLDVLQGKRELDAAAARDVMVQHGDSDERVWGPGDTYDVCLRCGQQVFTGPNAKRCDAYELAKRLLEYVE